MSKHLYLYEDEDLYALPAPDALGVLSSTRAVVEQGEYVWIDTERINALAEQWAQELSAHMRNEQQSDVWDDRYHFHDGTQRTANWLLVLDALNFCFWAEKKQPRWSIDYKGETLNGYWAEAAALTRAVEEGLPLWDAQYLSTISTETVAHIFRGTQTIPLLQQRVENAQEAGRILLQMYDGQFVHALEQAEGSAIRLVQQLIAHFPSFRDVDTYHGREVRFFKRAQICVADLAAAFHGKQWGTFTDLDQLTIYADYKLPQVLRHYNVLEYHSGLAERVDAGSELAAGSVEEIEIRACTIWACELLRRALLQHGCSMTNAAIDQRLWLLGQNGAAMRPYHRTRTIYY
ncbi:MAG: queuosine salvage family protein [Chloroflexota bacterium]|nr:queuosine salvage family protein [Chloroflexota bacterium]